MPATISQPQGVISPESAARIAEGVAAETGHGGAVEAHPVVTGTPLVTTPETVTASPVPVQPAAPAAAPAVVNVNVAPSK